MGRFYSGDISGKFWFGCQSSYDASNYGIEHKDVINFHVCNCACDDIFDKIYCESCYDSYEQHIESIKEEYGSEKYEDTWYISESEICYDFCEENLEQVNKKIKELEEKVGKYMSSFKIISENGEISYDIDITQIDLDDNYGVFCKLQTSPEIMYKLPISGENDELVARLCLGKQIQYSLMEKGSCTFICEC
jgi:hypothetical protein